MQQDEVELLNFSSIPCPETIFYAKYEIQNYESETVLQDLYEFETFLKNKNQICCVLNGSLYLYAFDSIPLLPESRPSVLVLDNSGSLSRSLFQREINPVNYLIQLNFVRALRRLNVYHLCKEYGFLSLKESLVPIRTASTYFLEGLDVCECPLLDLHIGFLKDGSMEFSFQPTGLSLYCLSNIKNLEDYLLQDVVLLPFGCKAKLVSLHSPSSTSTIETLRNRYGYSQLLTKKWVGIQVEFLDYAFSWPLNLCFLEKPLFSSHSLNDFDKYFSTEAYSFPFNASKDMLSKDQSKNDFFSTSENVDQIASTCAPLKPGLPNPLTIPSSPRLPIQEIHDPFSLAENGAEDIDRGNDLLMEDIEDIEDVGVTEADFDYFDLPTHHINPYSENVKEIELRSENLSQVGLENPVKDTQADHHQLPLSPNTFSQKECSIPVKNSSKSSLEPVSPKNSLKFSGIDDSPFENHHDEVVPPLYNAVPLPSSSVNIAKKYSIGGKYWCPSDLLSRSNSQGSITNSVSSVEDEKNSHEEFRETIECQSNSMENSIERKVPFPSLETKSAEFFTFSSVGNNPNVTKVSDSFKPLFEDYNLKHLKTVKDEDLLEIILSQPFYYYLLPFWRNQKSEYNCSSDSHDYLYIQDATKLFFEGLFSGQGESISLKSCVSWETEMNRNGTQTVDMANTYITNENQPGVILKYNNQKLTVDFSATKHWLSLNLQPLNERRNYTVLLFTHEAPTSVAVVKSVFDDIRYAYANSYFGKLELKNLVTFDKDGIIDYDSTFSMVFCESGNHVNEEKNKNISDLVKECANVYPNGNLLFLFFVDDSARSFFSICQFYNLFNEALSNETKEEILFNEKFSLKIIPSTVVCAIGQPLSMKDLSPITIALDIYNTSPMKNLSFKTKFRSYVVEKPIDTLLHYRLANTCSANALFNEYTLHMTYAIVLNKYVLCSWTDTYGEIEHFEWFVLYQTDQLVDVFQKIWTTTNDIMKKGSFTWYLSIIKVGSLSLEELNAWKQVAETQGCMSNSKFNIGDCLIYENSKSCVNFFSNIPFRKCNNSYNLLQAPENIEIAGIVREAATSFPNYNVSNIIPCLAYGLLGHTKRGFIKPVAKIQLFHLKQNEPTLVLRKLLKEYIFMSFSSIRNHYSSVPIPHNISAVLYQGQLLEYLRGGNR
ncbi:mediator complex subunit Srb9 [Schizosaccharomyces octosporus yFS286]|uniref:Mediator of RNA polymerase II transcription subunit 13 n=1 Tax=Schizosaccharomyces octosporus (strain yFS286) TaxID=483514 RepID=S9PVA9_SCHOY|nr:mediator complex subunit Srb9 [Schizosaccharomyces octosporus yFS286]EPX71433.1 mediator complex subunit Srb9 [Schizosaccharomyces octosporus yFS286]